MTIHMQAPSGHGQYALCGQFSTIADSVTCDIINVTCSKCRKMLNKQGYIKEEPKDINIDRTNSHYDVGGISVIDVMRAKLTSEQYVGFLLGSCLKYAMRLNFKGQKQSDAEKLAEYAVWLTEELASDKEKDPKSNG